MSQSPQVIAYCHSCGSAMNVNAVAPFSNVECPTCGKHTRVKREFGPYTLVSRHAVGGMSMVFLAHDNTLDREVALKILSEDFSADERRIAAFEEEARITASFSHPHVVRVLTTGKAFGRLYIAMELVPGGHFEHQIREKGKIAETEMLPLAIEVAQGLKAAHAAGLIHRDVKPGNILLDAEGHAKLVDFGLALVTKGGLAQAAEIWATPYYVPPETIEGYAEDFRSDIYAFGATLYHALAGVPSCGEETMATDVLREAKRKVVPLGTREPSISVETCKIVDRAMAYDPKDRYSSYDELIARLESALKRLKSGTVMESSKGAAERRAKTKQVEILTISAAALVLIGAVASGIWWVTREEPSKQANRPPMSDPMPVLPEAGENDAAEATVIAKSYREARAAVEVKDFEKASAAFSALLANSKVQEPTRTWAGVESVLSAYFNGKSSLAKKQSSILSAHIKSLTNASIKPNDCLIQVLDLQGDLQLIPLKDLDRSKSDASHVLSWLIAALKNWEQGTSDESFACFSKVASTSLSQDDEWISIYQRLAGDYVADREELSSPLFGQMPGDAKECESMVVALDAIHANLKTSGRAKFNVRAWQLDLARQAKLLNSSSPIAGGEAANNTTTGADSVTLTEVMVRLDEFANSCQFGAAADYLKELPADPAGSTRDSLTAIMEASKALLSDLEANLSKEGVSGDFQDKKGEAIAKVSADSQGALLITDTAGQQQAAKWADLSPDTIIGIHRIFVKNPMSDGERLNRHERAICYDWIAGNRERAVNAANLLSQGNPEFRVRWQQIASGLPK